MCMIEGGEKGERERKRERDRGRAGEREERNRGRDGERETRGETGGEILTYVRNRIS